MLWHWYQKIQNKPQNSSQRRLDANAENPPNCVLNNVALADALALRMIVPYCCFLYPVFCFPFLKTIYSVVSWSIGRIKNYGLACETINIGEYIHLQWTTEEVDLLIPVHKTGWKFTFLSELCKHTITIRIRDLSGSVAALLVFPKYRIDFLVETSNMNQHPPLSRTSD